jgi:hypothetical protein
MLLQTPAAGEAVFDTGSESNRPFSIDRRHGGRNMRQDRVPKCHGGRGGV